MTRAPNAARHLVVVGLPKAANTFIVEALRESIGAEPFQFCGLGNIAQQIQPDRLWQFLDQPCASGGEHMAATPYNLALLDMAGIERIALLVRDPRDVLVSWHHWILHTAPPAWSRAAHVASGIYSARFFSLSFKEQMDDLIETALPSIQDWLAAWLRTAREDRRFKLHILRYEDFCLDETAALTGLLQFFGHDREPIMPPRSIGGHVIDGRTKFRRGVVGCHKDEMRADQIGRANSLIDRALFKEMSWPI